jgi:hypothetical protein
MGAGASTASTLDAAAVKELVGENFDQELFDSLATDGTVTKAQLEQQIKFRNSTQLNVDAVAGIKVSQSGPALAGSAVQLEAQLEDMAEATKEEAKQIANLKEAMAKDALAVALFEFEEGQLSPEEREARQSKRRALIRDGCTAAMAEYKDMTEEERMKPQHQGRMDFYSEEAQATREKIRNHRRITRQLLRWWNATQVFDDRNHDDFLSKPEYESFYRRLLKLLDDNDDPDDDLTEEEKKEVMSDDFGTDAGSDGQVSKEEFKNRCICAEIV